MSLADVKKTDPCFEMPEWFKPDSEGKGSMSVFKSTDNLDKRMVVAYPAKNFECMHLSCVFPDRERQSRSANAGTWYDDVSLSEILNAFGDFTGVVHLLR